MFAQTVEKVLFSRSVGDTMNGIFLDWHCRCYYLTQGSRFLLLAEKWNSPWRQKTVTENVVPFLVGSDNCFSLCRREKTLISRTDEKKKTMHFVLDASTDDKYWHASPTQYASLNKIINFNEQRQRLVSYYFHESRRKKNILMKK